MELATLAKATAVAVKNRDKLGKIIGIVLLVLVMPLVILICAFLQIMAAFMPDGALKTPDSFDGATSAIYEVLETVTEPYYKDMKEDMQEEKEDIIEEYTTEQEVIGENGKVTKVKVVPEVEKKIHYISEGLIIAYLVQMEYLDTQKAVIDEQKATEFLEKINKVVYSRDGNNFTVENEIMKEEDIADYYFHNETDRQEFLATVEAYKDYFDIAQTKIITDDGERGDFTESILSVPLYLQYDKQWGSTPYGDSNISNAGCCPTSLAMVFSYLCQKTIYPNNVVAWAGDTYYVKGAGTSWSIFNPAAEHWGVKCTNISKNEGEMLEALQKGKLIVASMGPGTFTKGGHFIVLTGITESGKIKVNDPNDSNSKNHKGTDFEPGLILRECKNMWVFEGK